MIPDEFGPLWQSEPDADGDFVSLSRDKVGNYFFTIGNATDPNAKKAAACLEADEVWRLMSIIDRLLYDVVYANERDAEAPF